MLDDLDAGLRNAIAMVYAAGFKAGAEAMREEAAKVCDKRAVARPSGSRAGLNSESENIQYVEPLCHDRGMRVSHRQLMDGMWESGWQAGFADALALARAVCDQKPNGVKTDWNAGYDTACRHCSEDIELAARKRLAERAAEDA